MHVHHEKSLFLSVYVDDLKMAGRASEINGMWKQLQKHLALDPPTPLDGGTYLGQVQRDVGVSPDMVQAQKTLWTELFRDA